MFRTKSQNNTRDRGTDIVTLHSAKLRRPKYTCTRHRGIQFSIWSPVLAVVHDRMQGERLRLDLLDGQ
jgi:hypothetical protein